MNLRWKLLVVVVATAAIAGAQSNPNPLSADTKGMYESVKGLILRSADKMPEEHYSFKPTPEVRSYAALLGHIADAQYLFCAADKGEKKDPPGIEKTKTTKAELTAALKEAFAYCDSSYSELTDARGAQPVKFFGRDRTRLGVLNFNSSHTNEHYGNLVTYLRLKGLVPPSSEPRK